MTPKLIVRRERTEDRGAARAVQVAAFGPPGSVDEPPEARLLDELRLSDGWLPPLSLVVEIDGVVRGHVVTTRGHIDGRPALGLGPIGVDPAFQRRGIGLALVHATIGAAEALDEQLIALLGSPHYYGRFGFEPASRYRILAPDAAWGDHFQVLPLSAWSPALTGAFHYAEPFDRIE